MAGELLQVLVDTSSRPRGKFYSAGALTDLDAAALPTVTLTRPNGTAGPAAADITRVSQGIYDFRLVAADVPDPIVYDIAWSGNIGSQLTTITTQVEALGEFLFNVPDLRGLRIGNGKPFAATATPNFTDEQLLEARTATLDEFTRILGFSPVPRFRREIHNGNYSTCLHLNKLHAHKPLTVTINGVAKTISDYQINDANQLEAITNYTYGAVFTGGRRNVAVEYVHGWQQVEGEAGKAAMAWAAMRLLPGLADAASSVVTPDGTSISFDPAGQVTRAGRVRHSGAPYIDSWLNRHTVALVG